MAGNLEERLRIEAQSHASEARTANATIHEIYQVLSGGKGEPGNWHGAEPARRYVDASHARITELEVAVEQAFRDGLAYGSSVENADPDIAWGHSRARAALIALEAQE